MRIVGRRYDNGQPIWLELSGGRITDRGNLHKLDIPDMPWIAPGLVDLQANGYGGLEFTDPELTVEPIATYYLRLGKSYSFIRNVLQQYFSDSTLAQSYRLLPDGKSKSPENLLDELKSVESLMYGLFLLSAEEIGLRVQGNLLNRNQEQMKSDSEKAQEWMKSFKEDKDLFVDNRMMVPVFYDIQRRKTKVWVVLGYSVKPLVINFDKQPTFTVTDPKGKKIEKKVEFHKEKKKLIYPVSAEVYTDKILNREEFRSLCDSLKTQGAILQAIQSSKK